MRWSRIQNTQHLKRNGCSVVCSQRLGNQNSILRSSRHGARLLTRRKSPLAPSRIRNSPSAGIFDFDLVGITKLLSSCAMDSRPSQRVAAWAANTRGSPARSCSTEVSLHWQTRASRAPALGNCSRVRRAASLLDAGHRDERVGDEALVDIETLWVRRTTRRAVHNRALHAAARDDRFWEHTGDSRPVRRCCEPR